MQRVELKYWNEGGVQATPGRIWLHDKGVEYAYIRAEGRFLSRGSNGYAPLVMAAHAALAWPSNNRASGLITDLSHLDYHSGDTLLTWMYSRRIADESSGNFAIVASCANKDAICSLLEYQDAEELVERVCLSLDAALGLLAVCT